MKSKLFIAALFALVSGCSSLGQLDASTNSPGDSESVFVLGVAPANYRVSVFPGHIANGEFHQNLVRPAAVYGAAKDGYVVGKASAGDVLAITNVRVVKDSSSLLGADFKPCNGTKTIVFEVPKGSVLYLGSVEYQFSEKTLEVQYGQDFEGASRYIDSNYPALKGRLTQGSYQLLPVATGCGGGTMYIPIYIPMR